MLKGGRKGLAGVRIKDSDQPTGRREQLPTVRTEAEIVYCRGMLWECILGASGERVSKPNGPVFARDSNPASIRGKQGLIGQAIFRGQITNIPTIAHVPQPDFLVAADGQQPCAIGGELEGVQISRVLQLYSVGPRIGIPQAHHNGVPALSQTSAFTVIVKEVNVEPELALSGTLTVAEQSELVLSINGTDADLPANVLTYALLSGPQGATFNPTTREFRWTPSEAQGPGNFTAQFPVTDQNPGAVNEQQLSVTNALNIIVNEVNFAPSLVLPTNRTFHAGTVYSSSLGATDPDLPANTLTYLKVSGPEGMNVSATGLLTWATTETDANSTNIIQIRVTDNGTPSLTSTSTLVLTVDAPPRFTAIFKTGGMATGTWSAISGTSYQIQYKTNLADATWSELPGDVIASENTASFDDSSFDATRFYRLIVLP